jgi:hypothetical protein
MGKKQWTVWVASAALMSIAGCDELGMGPEGPARVSLSLTSEAGRSASASLSGTGAPSAFSPALVPVTDGSGRTIDLDTVQLVFREVELKRVEDDDCEGGDDRCEEFETGPVLVTLPLDGRVITPFAEVITPGTYDELELKLQHPEDDGGARERFFAQHPNWPARATVRVSGTFTPATVGATPQRFNVFLNVTTKVEQQLDPLLVVTDSTTGSSFNLTLAVDMNEWFRARNGSLIDPRSISASPALLAAVTQNVRASFRALRDDDRDGDDDEGRGRGRSGGDHDEEDEDRDEDED